MTANDIRKAGEKT